MVTSRWFLALCLVVAACGADDAAPGAVDSQATGDGADVADVADADAQAVADSAAGEDAAGDDAGDAVVADTVVADTVVADTVVADTVVADTAADTVVADADTDTVTADTVVTAAPRRADLLAWAIGTSNSVGLTVRRSTGTAFAPKESFLGEDSTFFGGTVQRVGDFDGDGKDDLLAWVVGTSNSVGLTVRRSTGTAFAPKESFLGEDSTFFGGTEQLVGDFDGDGRDDLLAWAIGTSNSVGLTVRRSTGTAFAPKESWLGEDSTFFGGTVQLVGDFDGDGKDDLLAWVVGTSNSVGLTVRRSTGTAFAPKESWLGEDSTFFGGTVQLVGDFDGDGKDDLLAWVIGTSNSVGLTVRRSTGTAFAPKESWLGEDSTFFGGTVQLVGDFDGDGKDDLLAWVVGTSNSVGLTVRRSTGTAFAPKESWLGEDSTFFGGTEQLVGDFDGE